MAADHQPFSCAQMPRARNGDRTALGLVALRNRLTDAPPRFAAATRIEQRLRTAWAEARVAYWNRDLARLEWLSSELAGYTPILPVPDDLRRGIERAIAVVKLRNARGQLQSAFLHLRAARAAGDFLWASAALRQWTYVIETRQILLPASLQEAIRPLTEWVDRQQRRQAQRERLNELIPAVLKAERRLRAARLRQRVLAVVVALTALAFFATLAYLYVPGMGRL